jgi:hypothetical protein
VLRDSASGYTGTLFSAKSGNGEWTSWLAGSNAAPIESYQPTLAAHIGPTQFLAITWFAPRNIDYSLETVDTLLPHGSWVPLAGATNLTAADSNLTVKVDMRDARRKFFRATGTPRR